MKTSILSGFIICLLLLAGSCNKVPTNPYKAEQQKVLLNRGRLVGDLASPANMHMAKIEGVALVEGLMGTGADEPPSTYQQMVYQELQKDPDRKSKAKHLIASMSTAIVLLEASIPPAAQAGDRLDVDVRLLPQSEATSLAGGYVENVPMHQYMAIDIIRKGSRLGVANGYVLLDPDLIERESPVAYKKGKIIGGVVLTKSRPLWLQLRDGEQSAGVASRIEDVINKRFNYKKAGYAGKRKVAEAKAGAVRINLVVPEEYKDNINRYVNVVCAISFFETEDELNDRITDLGVRLLNPEKSEAASLELEAIGSGN
ncbi:MAG: flagellar basal body P-ring protein FlgI, partial [Thermoguttaceae bacterium]|nr:flagellar basal body P-ring protein FlgI [Thermoguttaceae bacterium]